LDLESPEKNFQQLSKELVENLESVGFVYLKNHGIENYEDCDKMFREFFRQPIEEKMKMNVCSLTNRDMSKGYFPMESETFDDDGVEIKKDARECITFDADYGAKNDFMDDTMRPLVQDLVQQMGKLGEKLLQMIGFGLNLKDPYFFYKNHSFHSRSEQNKDKRSFTQMKYNYYPKLEGGLKPGQVQLGEHKDFNTITLLFQDQIGGLEVRNKEKFVPATPIPGTIILNVGIFLENWTNGKLDATPHRIIKKMNAVRGSTAFFMHPDSEVVLSPMEEFIVDGKTTYPTVLSGEYRNYYMKKMLKIDHELLDESEPGTGA